MSADTLKAVLDRISHGEDLTREECGSAFDVVMQGAATNDQIRALLLGLKTKGETAHEVAGAVVALRRAMIPVVHGAPESLVDTCGTGGGSLTTFNISTAAAILAAGAGVTIAKHGNRSFTSRSGSADVLEALGVRLDAGVDVVCRALGEAGIAFMFAPSMHPAMRHVGPVRRELATPTIMNLLGPLANPAGARRQVIGVADEDRMSLIAAALAELDTIHALVVYGEPGLDEFSPLGMTRVLEVKNGALIGWEILPSQFGIRGARAEDLAGGTPLENAEIITAVLSGRGSSTARAAVLMNAAAAIYVSGAAETMSAAYDMAESALQEGKGLDALNRLRRVQGSESAAR